MTHQGRVAWLGAPYFTGLGTGHVSVFPPLCSHWGRKILALFCGGGTGNRRRCLGPLRFLGGLFCKRSGPRGRFLLSLRRSEQSSLPKDRVGFLGGSQHPIPAGVQTGWVPSPAVLHGGCSEVAGFDGLVVPSGLRLDGGVQAYLGSPSWWLGCWFRRLAQEWAGRAWGACATSARFVTPQAHHPVWHQLRAGMALACSQQPWMAILVGRWAQRGPHSAPKGPSPVGPQGALCACLGNPAHVRLGYTESHG